MLNPLKEKHHKLYWQIAEAAAEQSHDNKHKVGCAIVTPDGLIAIGWNGTPVGFNNATRDSDGTTKDHVIHAERNAIDKLIRAGVSPKGAILFTTLAPCVSCALSIHGLGFSEVWCGAPYRCHKGVDLLALAGIPTYLRAS